MLSKAPGSAPSVKDRVLYIWVWIQKSRPYRTFSRFTDVGGSVLAAGMSFQAVFAIFAALWVGSGILTRWASNNPDLIDALITQINIYVPGLIAVDGEGVIPLSELLTRSGNLDWASIIGSLSLVWVAMTWFTGTRRAVRLIYGLEVKQYRNAALLKVVDLLGALTFFVALVISAALTVASSDIFSWFLELLGVNENNWFVGWVGLTVRYSALLLVDVLIIFGINKFLAEVKVPFRKLAFGSLLGGVALLLLKISANLLLSGGVSNPLLATFAVFVGLLVWFNIICRILLLVSAWIATGLDKNLGLPEGKTADAINLLD